MKQYKLLKDTPIFNAGTIFEGRVDGSGNLKALASLTAFGPQALPDFAIKDINNFDDWFARRGYQKERDNRIYNPNSNIANVLK